MLFNRSFWSVLARRIFVLVIMGTGLALVAAAAEIPGWAFTVNPPAAKVVVPDDGRAVQVPDSAVTFTRSQINNLTGPVPDWHPEEHPAMPDIVARGRGPKILACAYCHLPNGAGRPENASLAGLPATYIQQQLRAFQHGERPGSEPKRLPQTLMIAGAMALTDAEIESAARYFAALPPVANLRVTQTASVPTTKIAGWVLTPMPGGVPEPIGHRIIETPGSFQRFEDRDSRTPYIVYVPPGSVQRGAELAHATRGAVLACVSCHGAELNGLGDIPRLAGRSPSFLMRQLIDLRRGARRGGASDLMRPVVADLTDADLLALAAYLASLQP